jgi:clan AA aspartic protease
VITGTVSRHRAYVNLIVRGPNGQEGEIEAVLDTGFTGVITLPPAACIALGLSYVRPQPAHLAGRRPVILDVFECHLWWDGTARNVEVLGLDGAPLIGMALLDGFDVRLQVAEGGLISIEPL